MGIALKHLSEHQRAEIARSLFKDTSEDKNKGELIGRWPFPGHRGLSHLTT
jgi:hypothetical protein